MQTIQVWHLNPSTRGLLTSFLFLTSFPLSFPPNHSLHFYTPSGQMFSPLQNTPNTLLLPLLSPNQFLLSRKSSITLLPLSYPLLKSYPSSETQLKPKLPQRYFLQDLTVLFTSHLFSNIYTSINSSLSLSLGYMYIRIFVCLPPLHLEKVEMVFYSSSMPSMLPYIIGAQGLLK